MPASDVDDVVQATLTDALMAKSPPADPESFRKWLWGIARHKIADVHRKGRREVLPAQMPDAEAPQAPHDAGELLRWAEKELPAGEGAHETLGWLLREGDGEKLEHIADEHELPAPRVRQRVSRLRQHFKARWQAQAAAFAAIIGAAVLLWLWLSGRANPKREPEIVREVPSANPPIDPALDRARELRRLALERCAARDHRGCLDGLDEAKKLDPVGDEAPPVVEARKQAAEALAPPPSAVPSAVPSAPPSAPSSAPPSAPMQMKGEPVPTNRPAPRSSDSASLPSKPTMPDFDGDSLGSSGSISQPPFGSGLGDKKPAPKAGKRDSKDPGPREGKK